MPTYLHPGVYIEEIPSAARPIAAASTSIPIFIGAAKNGPLNKAEFLLKWDDYGDTYGGITGVDDAMGLAVSSFYANGGGSAYIARLAQGAVVASLPAASGGTATMPGKAGGALNNKNPLAFTAASPGKSGDQLGVQAKNSNGVTFDLEISRTVDGQTKVVETFKGLGINNHAANFTPSVLQKDSKYVRAALTADATANVKKGSITGGGSAVDFATIAENDALKLDIDGLGAKTVTIPAPAGGTYDAPKFHTAIVAEVKKLGPQPSYQGFTSTDAAGKVTLSSGTTAASSLIKIYPSTLATKLKLLLASAVVVRGDEDTVPRNMAAAVSLAGGDDGAAPGKSDYENFLADELVKFRDVSIILLPGHSYTGASKDIIDAALTHCESMKSRMVIVDPPSSTELRTAAEVDALGLPTSTYSVLYYPWLKVSNPFFDAEKRPAEPPTLTIAPSAAAAGMWAKIDGRRGVWKAPAGINTRLLGVAKAEFDIEDGIQDQLNPLGVNCIRNLPRFNYVFWGARTLATNSEPEWRYVPIRRTAIMIERSIYEGIQWAVFEPNDHNLWASLRLNIGTFMDGLHRAGAFQGEKASDAYFVNCGLGDTMTQGDIDAGRVIAVVGFAPLKPAEFVIIRIQQKVAQQ